MNKAELIRATADKTGMSMKDADKIISAAVDTIVEELASGGKVQLVGFGAFEVKERAARQGRNPQTKQVMKIAASKSPKFKPGKALKDTVNA